MSVLDDLRVELQRAKDDYEPSGQVEWLEQMVAKAEAEAEETKFLREALDHIASDLSHPGSDEWNEAMDALGLDKEAALEAWND